MTKRFILLSCVSVLATFACCDLSTAVENESQEVTDPSQDGIPVSEEASDVNTQSFNERNHLSLSTTYATESHTNPQMALFGIELLQGGAYLSEKSLTGNFNNAITRSLSFLLNTWVMRAFETSYHELGHAMRCKAYGLEYAMYTGKSKSGEDVKKNRNFFTLFTKMLPRAFSEAHTSYLTGKTDNTANLLISTSGVNNEMFFSEAIETELDKGAHWNYFAPYVQCKLSSMFYRVKRGETGNDMSSILDSYKALGIKVSKSDINLASTISLLASGSTYRLASGFYDFCVNGTQEPFKAYSYKNFRMPDVNTYLTSKGISYKVKSGYKLDETLMTTFAIEHVFKGKSTSELSLGARKKLSVYGGMTVGGQMIIGRGFGLEASVSMPVIPNITAEVDAARYDSKTLYGERNITDLTRNRKKDNVVWAQVSWLY